MKAMPWWRRLLCVLIGAPLALAGIQFCLELRDGGSHAPLFWGSALVMSALGALLVLSGISPSAARGY